MRAPRSPALLLVTALLACEPPDQPPPGPTTGGDTGGSNGGPQGGGSGGGSGGGGNGGNPGSPGGDGTSTLDLAVAHHGSVDDASALDLETVALAMFVGADPRYANASTSCDGGGAGALLDLKTTVTLDLQRDGATPLASVDVTHGGELHEAWLVLRRGSLHRDGREYKVHADALCTMPDGLQYTLVRLRPGGPVTLGGPDHRIVATFDPQASLEVEHVDCRASDAEECRSSDDDHDDGDPDTRLRFSFPTSLPVTVDP
jgi:hypothetical protein